MKENKTELGSVNVAGGSVPRGLLTSEQLKENPARSGRCDVYTDIATMILQLTAPSTETHLCRWENPARNFLHILKFSTLRHPKYK